MCLIFYDFEVFKYDWLVVLIEPASRKETVIINDPEKLRSYYEAHSGDIWIGYNSRGYDQYILKGILCGFNPKEINDFIIVKDKFGWQFSDLMRKISLYNYDVQSSYHSLKQLEAFMGNDIRETSVSFTINRKLTEEEIAETIKYCRHDVEQTIEVFLHRINRFNSQIALIKAFDLPLRALSRTQALLAADILGAKRKTFDDEWDIRIPDNLEIDKYKSIPRWFLDPTNYANGDDVFLNTSVGGVPHVFAWGGIHGAKRGEDIKAYSYACKKDEILIMADVDQLYPTIMVEYDLLSRAITRPDKYKIILNESLRLKAEGKKKERQPYKDICNITYGAMGDKHNQMFDPLHRKLVCVYGQLFLLDLIEKLESVAELIQSNTDGLLLKIKRSDFDKVDDIVYNWEQRTKLHMSFDYYEKIIQKDVNNYVAIDYDGKIKGKGAYAKELNDIDNDLPIVNRAVKDFIISGTRPETTIRNCNELIEFQKVVHVSRKYAYGVYKGHKLTDKTFRVFASKRPQDGKIGKCKTPGGTIEKFANTPDNCFISNVDINDATVPEYLDRQWYVNIAVKRLQDFGMEV